MPNKNTSQISVFYSPYEWILSLSLQFSSIYFKQTWKKLTAKDCREWKLTTVDPQERSTWRSGVRSAMRAASQLPGKGPTDVDDAPAPAR